MRSEEEIRLCSLKERAEYKNLFYQTLYITGAVTLMILIIISLIFGIWMAVSKINIWTASNDGKSELAQADWNRQIVVKEAQAKMLAAKELAQADIERAKGVAKSNKIIGKSLNKNEAYLT